MGDAAFFGDMRSMECGLRHTTTRHAWTVHVEVSSSGVRIGARWLPGYGFLGALNMGSLNSQSTSKPLAIGPPPASAILLDM